jgi:DNA-binding NtrC family response regulator
MVSEGSFREDLYFRVNTFEIHLPPLREHREDIPELAQFLLARYLKRPEISLDILSPEALEVLINHDWRGNVRELANALEHAVILSDGQTITPDEFPASVTRGSMTAGEGFSVTSLQHPKTLSEVEMEMIYRVLEKHGGDKPKTANELGIALKTLYNRLHKYESQKEAG